jgi:NAD(P)-dependent dehydrogenase (short-subunit alcohol dehydrogenase family)
VRIALVSGGNRGIGYEVVRQLAGLGHTVILGARDLAKGQAAARELAAWVSGRVVAKQLDVVDAQDINNLARQVTEEFGRLDILVNNAAVHYDTWQTATKADIEGIVRDAVEKAAGNRERAIRNVCRLYTVNRFDALPGAIRTAMLALLDETVPII